MKARSLIAPWLWAPLILVVDFVSKRVVLANADLLRGRVDVIGDLVRFAYVRNPGAAMGLFPIGQKILVSVSIVASLFLIYLYWRSRPEHLLRRSALAAILGGALGNLIDRLFYGGLVVDFIDIGIGDARFYTFNVADMGVTIGGALLLLCYLRGGKKEPETVPAVGLERVPAAAGAEDAHRAQDN